MRYSAIKTCDLNNGVGLRVSLWTQGCGGYCKSCQNKETWDRTKGKEFTQREYEMICNEIKRGQNLSIIGGEPLEEYNIKDLTDFLERVKGDFPDLNIWLWTHFDFEEIQHLELMKYIDVLIDGKYIDDLHCDFRKSGIVNDRWRGSTNQRIIDVQESLKKNEVFIWKNGVK